jgi:transcriptional regulator with XRE-family HTH domain
MREIDKGYAPGAERPGIGHMLERERRRQGMSLEEVERATRIRKDYLVSLESDDHLDVGTERVEGTGEYLTV